MSPKSKIPKAPTDNFDAATWRSLSSNLLQLEDAVRRYCKKNRLSYSSSSRWPELRIYRAGILGIDSISVQLDEKYYETGQVRWRIINRFVPWLLTAPYTKSHWSEVGSIDKNISDNPDLYSDQFMEAASERFGGA